MNRAIAFHRPGVLIGICVASLHASAGLCQDSSGVAAESGVAQLQEITVTATRQAEPLSKVPISVSAFTAEKMAELHVKTLEDVQAYTPGLALQSSGVFDTTVSIRGIRSVVGSATTGVYIDDTPIQVRSVGYTSFNLLPNVFDLDRVEVLRGPQGTLFGAGSEGGTVRYITPTPNMTGESGFATAEGSFSDDASASYEAGGAYGAPIVDGKVGFRASAWYRRTGGYVDWVDRTTLASRDTDINSVVDKVGRLAIGFKPTEALTITPSVFFQERDWRDSPQFWEYLSNPDTGRFVTGKNIQEPIHDKFTLSSVNAQYNFEALQLISVTSYFDRRQDLTSDYSYLFPSGFTGNPFVPGFPNYTVAGLFTNNQRNWTEELRLQSTPSAGSRMDWTVGIFYTHNRQSSTQLMRDPDINDFLLTDLGGTVEQIVGVPLYQGQYSVYFLNETLERQLAGFAEVHWNITDALKLTVGARASHAGYDYHFVGDGPYNGGHSESSGTDRENPVTEKVGLSYQVDPATMVYATASKGYRIGGANTLISESLCAQDLANLGLQHLPATYNSDSLWNYELGAKFKFLDNRVHVDASVYYIDWKNIQQMVVMPTCAFTYIANLNKATSRGFDLSADARLTERWSANLALGYTDAFYPDNTYGGINPTTGARSILFGKGDPLGVPPWNASIGSRYEFPVWSGKKGYVRADYSYTAGYQVGPGPGTSTYDPAIRNVEKTNLLKARLGVNLTDDWEVDLFGDNLLNDAPLLGRAHLGSSANHTVFTNVSLFPRTFGLSTTIHF